MSGTAVRPGRRILLDLLFQEGVEVIFGNPGTTELPLLSELRRDGRIRYVLALQEAAAMAMADGYARAGSRLGVVNLHAAPGLGNAMGMLFDAAKGGTPLLVTAGQQAQGFGVTEPNLQADLATLARPFVKWSTEVRSAAELPRVIHRAVKVALAPPQGPVFVSLPVDVLNETSDVPLGTPTRVASDLAGDAGAIRRAAATLAAARRPVIVAGDAVVQRGAEAELGALAEALGCPVYLECEASSLPMPPAHPLFAGALARSAGPIRSMLEGHDLLLSIGADLLTLSLPYGEDPVPLALRMIHLDLDPWQLGKNYPADPAILADPKTALPLLRAALDEAMGPPGREAAGQRRAAVGAQHEEERVALQERARRQSEETPLLPLAAMVAIAESLPEDAIVVEEAVSSVPGLLESLRLRVPNSFFGLRGGGIGWGLPAAAGIALARAHQPVVALIGDGSAMYTIQALWTAAHERLGIVFVILNNRSYRILKQRHRLGDDVQSRDDLPGMDLMDPPIDFVGLAHSLGLAAMRANTAEDLRICLVEGLRSRLPLLIDVNLASTP